jgi:hypothetical protein
MNKNRRKEGAINSKEARQVEKDKDKILKIKGQRQEQN